MFGRPKASPESRLFEEQIYAQVVEELAQGRRRDGLWAKALADSKSQEEIAKSLYIRYRVQSIKDEIEIATKNQKATEERQANLKKMENARKSKHAQAKAGTDYPVFDSPMTAANWFFLFLYLGVILFLIFITFII